MLYLFKHITFFIYLFIRRPSFAKTFYMDTTEPSFEHIFRVETRYVSYSTCMTLLMFILFSCRLMPSTKSPVNKMPLQFIEMGLQAVKRVQRSKANNNNSVE
ncbi:hypothetical protein BC941DRAFT_160313 [Chlamydoabsidia padenii]|nr:hypothetical protein BC941DRAFT_160313 [Chlamydoabsidia padenii]